MKRVLLTGARGFIGRHAIRPLLERGYEVHAVTSGLPPAECDGAQWHTMDLLDPSQSALTVAAIRPSHLLHLAWYVDPRTFWTAPENLDWVGATLRLVRSFREAGGTRAVLAGTCAEYRWGGDVLVEDETPLEPATLYGSCKLATHVAAQAYSREAGLSLAWGRIFLLYGPHEAQTRLVASVIRALLSGEVARCSSGEQIRDFMHVADVAEAFVAVLDTSATGAYNIASGRPVSVREIVETIGGIIGRPDLISLGALPPRAGDPARICASVTRQEAATGWRPRYSLQDGLRDTIEWWRSHEVRIEHV